MANSWAHDRARPFYLAYAIMAVAAVLIGFSTTYFIPGPSGTLGLQWIVHVHGWTAMAWVGLLLGQILLIRARKLRLHRSVGALGLPLAASIWATGIAVGLWTVERDLAVQGEIAYAGLAGTACSLTVFLLLVIAAVRMRRRPDWHKRLILLATIVVLWPAFFRFRHLLPFVPRPELVLGLLLSNVWILVAALRDKLRWGRVHPAWLYGGPLIFLEQALELWAFGAGWFTPLGRALFELLV